METEFYIVSPSEGFRIIDDHTMSEIPSAGVRVRRSAYWDRLHGEGAVVFVSDKPVSDKPVDDKPVDEPVTPEPKPKKPASEAK